jgi:hypothetical protein
MNQPPKHRAQAWDPTSPFSLSLCPTTDNASSITDVASLGIFLSHDGTGIHPIETTCLTSLLDARDAYHANANGNILELSKDYRRAMCECLMSLPLREDNYESLACMYAMMHLTESYLLPVPCSKGRSTDKLDGLGGSLTADTVRYLRLHHNPYNLNSVEVQMVLNADQPEYYMNDSLKDSLLVGPFPQPYYNLVWHLVKWGQLSSAWGVLSRHSSCRRAEEEIVRHIESPESEAWSALRALLLSAPLPGGRGDEDDSGLMTEYEEVDGDAYERYMPDVSRVSPCLFEANPKNVYLERRERYRQSCLKLGVDPPMGDLEMLPDKYDEAVAMTVFLDWRQTVSSYMRGDSGLLSPLFSRFPQLEQICSILIGHSTESAVSWSERLVSELIYQRPEIAPADIAVRARVAMRCFGVEEGSWEKMILKVMEGDAGEVVSSMFDFGGGSGAALPATLVSWAFFCCMSIHLLECCVLTVLMI